MKGYKWHPIEDLPEDWRLLADPEFPSLVEVWHDYQETLPCDAIEQFQVRLHREWSIETGIIEGVYTLDRGITENLIAKGIDAALIPDHPANRSPEYVAQVIQDHADALDGLFAFVKDERELSVFFIKQLHQQLLRHQETFDVRDSAGQWMAVRLQKGVFKTLPNSPQRPDGTIHEYCPPEHTASEMDRLVAIHAGQRAQQVPADLQATWLHHAFTQIHPFQDGNGRVARALASIVLIRERMFPFVVRREARSEYIEALEEADQGKIHGFDELLVSSQRLALVQAVRAALDLRPPSIAARQPTTVEDAIAAVRGKLTEKRDSPVQDREVTRSIALNLNQFALDRFRSVAEELARETTGTGANYRFEASQTVDSTANGSWDGSRATLLMNSHPNFAIEVRMKSVTAPFSGLVCVTGSVHGTRGIEDLPSESFLVNYRENLETAQLRFKPWLENVIVLGLNEWRRLL